MKFGKVLYKTALASGIAMLALGAGQAVAAEGVAFLGHMSASVTSALNITEISPMRFGNFSVTCAGGGCTADGAKMVLSFSGTRTATNATDTIVPLTGAGSSTGIATGADQETGSQQPGFFSINTGVASAQAIYITFADNAGNIVDSNGDNVHPNNRATLTNGAQTFTVNNFTFDDDDSSTGYVTGGTAAQTAPYGRHITTSAAGLARIRVGATLYTTAQASYPPGRYTGTYYIMAAY